MICQIKWLNRILNDIYLSLPVPTDIDVAVHCHSNQCPDTGNDEEVEDWVANIGEEPTIGIRLLHCRQDHDEAVSQKEEYQYSHVVDRLGDEVELGRGLLHLPAPDEEGQEITDEAKDKENSSGKGA